MVVTTLVTCAVRNAHATDPKWGLLPSRSATNRLANPSAENVSASNAPLNWVTQGCEPPALPNCQRWRGNTQSQCMTGCPPPQTGLGIRYFTPPAVTTATLYQDVNVADVASTIDAGSQLFELQAHVRSATGSAPDHTLLSLQYYSSTGALISTTSIADIVATSDWRPVLDIRPAPAGTRKIRVSLSSVSRDASNKAFFDGLSFAALNEGDATPMKGVYFFPGPPPYGVFGTPNPPCPPPGGGPCLDLAPDRPQINNFFTQDPVSDSYLKWRTPLDREWILSDIISTQANTIVMSYWGPIEGVGGPMRPVWPYDYDALFESVGRDPLRRLRILPAIEGIATPLSWGDDCQVWPSRELPLDITFLYTRTMDLVNEFYRNPLHPEWRGLWQTMYDQDGKPRLAINVLHFASALTPPGDRNLSAAALADALDAVANQVNQTAHLPLPIGFTVDPITPHCSIEGEPTGYGLEASEASYFAGIDPGGTKHGSSVLGIQAFNPEITSHICFSSPCFIKNPPDACYEGHFKNVDADRYLCHDNNDANGKPVLIEHGKREWVRGWVESGVPLILDVSTGYDGHRVFWNPADPERVENGIYGDNSSSLINDSWRNQESAFKGRYGNFTTKGVVFNAWNGFAEGLAAAPARYNQSNGQSEPYDTAFNWLTMLFNGDPRTCEHWHFLGGAFSGSMIYGEVCEKWKCLGGENVFGYPVSLVEVTPGGTGAKASFFRGGAIYYSSATGAHEVHGAILEAYMAAFEDDPVGSGLGLPVSDEVDGPIPGTRISYFEHGFVEWFGSGDAFVVPEGISRPDMDPPGPGCH